LGWLALVNVVLGVFNLLPGAPLDGGRVLRALLWRWRGDREQATMLAAQAGHSLGVLLVLAGLAEVVFLRTWNGLWLALVGWFLLSAANAETAASRYRRLLGRIPVRAVMHPDPACGHPDQSVDDFIATVAARRPHRAFPLRDDAGRPAGLVRLADLGRVPPERRPRTPLSAMTAPTQLVPVLDARQPLADVAPAVARGGLALVVNDGQLVGVIDADDLTHATELAALAHPTT
jgi:CBS domain-containing protein